MTDRAAAIDAFLDRAGFGGATRQALAGDASIRRYVRLTWGPRPAILMDADPALMDVQPFLRIAAWLSGQALSAPDILAADRASGLVLLEDLGERSFTHELNEGAAARTLYGAAVDLLVELQRARPPADLPPYAVKKFLSEAALLVEWYAPDLDEAAGTAFGAIWQQLLPKAATGAPCLVYVDYHADNLIWLPARPGHARVGLLDFQDARLGPPAYDLASLLEDARRDVAPELAESMIERYLAARPELDPATFRASYAILAAQRNAKILGLFTRLARRDGKPRYLAYLEHVRGHLRRDLGHPALAPLRAWCERHLPAVLAP